MSTEVIEKKPLVLENLNGVFQKGLELALSDGSGRIRVPFAKEYFENSPITEKELIEYTNYKEEYVKSHIKEVSPIFNQFEELERLELELLLPLDTSVYINTDTKADLRNSETQAIEQVPQCLISEISHRSVYEEEVTDLLDSFV